MEQKIDVAQLLKGCPTGMELDCALVEGLEFDSIVDNEYLPIRCRIKHPNGGYNVYNFTKYGCWLDTTFAKCIIFPKGKTTWEGFVPPCKFKDGDILYIDCNNHGDTNKKYQYIFILKEINKGAVYCYCYISNDKANTHKNFEKCCLSDMRDSLCFATEEEKQKLFQAIKANGYKWNPDTKTLEKLPKFKVGDEIVKRNSITNSWIVNSVSSEYYGLKLPNGFEGIGVLPVSEQDDWELVHNKLEKLVEPRFKVGDRVMRKCGASAPVLISSVGVNFYYTYSHTESSIGVFPIAEQDDWVLVPDKFDINTLKPFDQMLVRQNKYDTWHICFFEKYNKDLSRYHFVCMYNNKYARCIPIRGK